MEGGDLSIKISPDYSITMSGPATKVGVYEMSPSVLSQNVPIKCRQNALSGAPSETGRAFFALAR